MWFDIVKTFDNTIPTGVSIPGYIGSRTAAHMQVSKRRKAEKIRIFVAFKYHFM